MMSGTPWKREGSAITASISCFLISVAGEAFLERLVSREVVGLWERCVSIFSQGATNHLHVFVLVYAAINAKYIGHSEHGRHLQLHVYPN